MNKLNIIKYLLIVFIAFCLYVVIRVAVYINNQCNNMANVEFCSSVQESVFLNYNKNCKNNNCSPLLPFKSVISDPDSCFCKMYNLLIPKLLVYKVKYNNKNIKEIKVSSDLYTVPTIAIEKTDAILSYGAGSNVDFERNLADFYKKNIYIYDCGISDLPAKHPKFIFRNVCIGTDKFILKDEENQVSSGMVSSFKTQLEENKLFDKKVYIKMDITGAEISVLPEILQYSDNITGMSVMFHLYTQQSIIETAKLLNAINDKFILIYRRGNPNWSYSNCNCKYIKKHVFYQDMCLTFINKNYVTEKHLALIQNDFLLRDYTQFYAPDVFYPNYSIDWIVTLSEILNINEKIYHYKKIVK